MNPNQKRHLAAVLRLIEKNLGQEEQLLRNRGEKGVLYEVVDTVCEEQRPVILAQIAKLRQSIALAKDRFDLATEQTSVRQSLGGKLNMLWVWLQDIKTKKLASYGAVDRTLERDLDPLLIEMAELIDQMLTMLREGEEGATGRSHGCC
jgi:hypothetical protein